MEEQQPLPPAPSLGTTITDVFASPSEVFQSLKGTASTPKLWVVPLIAMFLVVALITVMLFTNETLKVEMKDVQSKAIQTKVEQGKLTQEQADQAESRMDSMGGMMIVFGIIGAAIFICAYYFGGALFLWLSNKTILKSTMGYGKYLELYGIASWIGVLGGIIAALMMVGLGTMTATPSAALAVLGSYDSTSNFHKLLSAINIFSIWETAVIGIGLSKFSGKSTGAGMGVAFALWIIWVALSIFLGISR
jgi:hypothetical protein